MKKLVLAFIVTCLVTWHQGCRLATRSWVQLKWHLWLDSDLFFEKTQTLFLTWTHFFEMHDEVPRRRSLAPSFLAIKKQNLWWKGRENIEECTPRVALPALELLLALAQGPSSQTHGHGRPLWQLQKDTQVQDGWCCDYNSQNSPGMDVTWIRGLGLGPQDLPTSLHEQWVFLYFLEGRDT